LLGLLEQLRELNMKIDTEMKTCIEYRDSGKIEDAKRLLLKIKNLQNQKKALELKIENYDENQEEQVEEEPVQQEVDEVVEPEEPVEEEPVQEEEEEMAEEEASQHEAKSAETEVCRRFFFIDSKNFGFHTKFYF
jgi:uncharacterized membrane protein